MKKTLIFLSCFLTFSFPALHAAEDSPLELSELEEETLEAEAEEPAEETSEDISKRPTLTNMVKGMNRGTEKLLDHTIKGAYKVATLGQSELERYEVEEPEKGSGDITKFKISIPGT